MPRKSKGPRSGGSYIRQKDGTLRRLTPEEHAALSWGKSFDQAVDELLADEGFSASAVFDRIKEAMGCDTDVELAFWLGTTSQNIWNRRNRNSVPYREAIFVSVWARVSLDYLLTGVLVPAYRWPWERADHELLRGILNQMVNVQKGATPLDERLALTIAHAYERAEALMVELVEKERLSSDEARAAVLSRPDLLKAAK